MTSVLADLRKRGITRVELGSTHIYEPDLDVRLRDAFGDYTFLTHNFFPPPAADPTFVINLSDDHPDRRTAAVTHTVGNMRFAATIGSRLHTVHPGFIGAASWRPTCGRNYDFGFRAGSADRASAWKTMLEGLAQIVDAMRTTGVPLAVETQGSVGQSAMCLLQTSHEAKALSEALPGIRLNVNLGHLNLASRVFEFDRLSFIETVAPNVAAFELSHNDGSGDQHLPLVPGEWYWDVISDPSFRDVPMILELRDVAPDIAARNLELINSVRPSAAARA